MLTWASQWSRDTALPLSVRWPCTGWPPPVSAWIHGAVKKSAWFKMLEPPPPTFSLVSALRGEDIPIWISRNHTSTRQKCWGKRGVFFFSSCFIFKHFHTNTTNSFEFLCEKTVPKVCALFWTSATSHLSLEQLLKLQCRIPSAFNWPCWSLLIVLLKHSHIWKHWPCIANKDKCWRTVIWTKAFDKSTLHMPERSNSNIFPLVMEYQCWWWTFSKTIWKY